MSLLSYQLIFWTTVTLHLYYTYIHITFGTATCMYVCMYACTNVCMYVSYHMYVCMYVSMYVWWAHQPGAGSIPFACLKFYREKGSFTRPCPLSPRTTVVGVFRSSRTFFVVSRSTNVNINIVSFFYFSTPPLSPPPREREVHTALPHVWEKKPQRSWVTSPG